MTSKVKESLEDRIAVYLGKLTFTRRHIKALLRNTRMREGILARADREGLVAADVDNLSSSDFDSFCDAAWEVFGEEAPIVKTYTVEGDDPYEVEIIGVKGAYMVRASEFDDKGLFGTLKEAEACVEFNWEGQAEEDVT